ncbi:hypothetical protein CsSME_00018232 [Camellia sinensis var. sinensis]
MNNGSTPQAGPSYWDPPPPPVTTAAGNSEKWGTHIMGAPAVPTSHPANQKAALWTAGGGGGGDHSQAQQTNHPYLYYSSVDKPNTTTSPMECILHKFNSWSKKAEITSHNIWNHLKTGPSVSEAAWDKVNLTAKAITGSAFESLYKQTFATFPNEKLKKTFACYLSTHSLSLTLHPLSQSTTWPTDST